MNGSVIIILHKSFRDDDRIFIVVSIPWHICNSKIAPDCQFSVVNGLSISENLSFYYLFSSIYTCPLMNQHVRVRTIKSTQWVSNLFPIFIEYRNMLRINTDHLTIFFCLYDITRSFTDNTLHTSTNNRCISSNKRNCLTHHIGSHFRTSRIIMLQKRNKCRCF